MSDRESELAAANARIAELEDKANAALTDVYEYVIRLAAANARADEAEREMRSTELCARHYEKRLIEEKELFAAMVLEFGEAKDRAESEAAALRLQIVGLENQVEGAELAEQRSLNEVASLRAEVERLREERDEAENDKRQADESKLDERKRRIKSNRSLTEARALLETKRWTIKDWQEARDAWLAANPESPRAAAERALLDACASAIIYDDASLGLTLKEDYAICKAVLAWREAGK